MVVRIPHADDFAECLLEFTILPNTDDVPGQVVADLQVQDRSAEIRFTPQRDGTALPHYEFDTRVLRLESHQDPARLVWKGKLHGHEGPASFRLDDLGPGDYEVRTYPSPQDVGTPPVSADGDDGFVFRFHIDGPPALPAPPPAPPPEQAPAPALAFALAALGGCLTWLRRR